MSRKHLQDQLQNQLQLLKIVEYTAGSVKVLQATMWGLQAPMLMQVHFLGQCRRGGL